MRFLRSLALLLLVCSITFPQALVVHNGNNNVSQANLAIEYRLLEGSGQYALNHVTSTVVPSPINYWSTGEQFQEALLAVDSWTTGGIITFTDFFATDPNGNQGASRAQFGSGAIFYQQPSLAAGTYTASVWVKSNTGLSQNIRFLTQSGFSADKAVTTSWTQISTTVVLGSPSSGTIGFITDSGGNAADILMYGALLQTGSSGTGYQVPTFDMQLGSIPIVDSHDPTWISSGQTMGTPTYDYGISTNGIAATASISVYAVVNKTGATITSGMEPIISERYASLKMYLASSEIDSTGTLMAKVPTFDFSGVRTYGYNSILADGNPHILAATSDGSNVHLYIDGTEVAHKPSSITPVALHRMYLGRFTSREDGSVYFPGNIHYTSVYRAYHNQTQVQTNTHALQSLMHARGLTLIDVPKFIAIEGDSLTDPAAGVTSSGAGGPLSNGWGYIMMHNLSTPAQAQNFALSGSSMHTTSPIGTSVQARAGQVDATYNVGRSKNIFVIFIGANDLNSGITAAAFVNDLKTYCLARKATGWKVVVCTLLPQNLGNPAVNPLRNAINALIAGDPSFYDVLADTGAESHIGPDAAASNTALYYDGEHMTSTAQAYFEAVVETAVLTLW